MKSDRRIKWEATRREMVRVFENMNLPARDIIAECNDGIWVRAAWNSIGIFGWDKKWKKCDF